MGRGPTKSNENVYFVARKKAAMYNERLYSREGAAELLGISVSTLADYELGNTKVVPVDKVVLMADLYNAPELKTGYCKYECPICSYLPVATEAKKPAEKEVLPEEKKYKARKISMERTEQQRHRSAMWMVVIIHEPRLQHAYRLSSGNSRN